LNVYIRGAGEEQRSINCECLLSIDLCQEIGDFKQSPTWRKDLSFLSCGYFVERLSESEGTVHTVKRGYPLSHVRGRLGWEKKGREGALPWPKQRSDFRFTGV